MLARHLGQLARQALRFVGGPDAAALARQVDLANDTRRASQRTELAEPMGCRHRRKAARCPDSPGYRSIPSHRR